MNNDALKVMKKLSSAGITTEKELQAFGMKEFIDSDLKKEELEIVYDLQAACKTRTLYEYLCMDKKPNKKTSEDDKAMSDAH